MILGDEVDMLVPPEFHSTVNKFGLHLLKFGSDSKESIPSISDAVQGATNFNPMEKVSILHMKTVISLYKTVSTKYCRIIMEDEELMSTMTKKQYDLVIIDGLTFFRCIYIIPHRLKVPFITLTALLDPLSAGVTSSPAVEPSQMVPFTNKMSFIERLSNFGISLMFNFVLGSFLTVDNSLLAEYVPDGGVFSFSELYRRSEMWLVNFENLCLDYPRVTAPHYQYIGGSSGVDAKPIPSELSQFVNGAEHGLIVLSFGSIPFLSDWKTEKAETFMKAFGRLKQRVIIRYTGSPIENIPSNVLVQKWLPQNDLLGHNKTVLFITHCGNNGQVEALYHSVPMLAFPIMGDQVYNSLRVIEHGYGRALTYATFTSDELYETITEMISNPEYKRNIAKCSSMMKQQPTATQQLHFWTHHVIEYGSTHLRPATMDLSLPQIFMWDILLFLLLIIVVVIYIVRLVCRYACKRCGIRKQKTE